MVRLNGDVIKAPRQPGAERAFASSDFEDSTRPRSRQTASDAAKSQPRRHGELREEHDTALVTKARKHEPLIRSLLRGFVISCPQYECSKALATRSCVSIPLCGQC